MDVSIENVYNLTGLIPGTVYNISVSLVISGIIGDKAYIDVALREFIFILHQTFIILFFLVSAPNPVEDGRLLVDGESLITEIEIPEGNVESFRYHFNYSFLNYVSNLT